MQYLNNIKTSCKDFLNVFSTFENLVKTEGVKLVCKHGKYGSGNKCFQLF